MRKTVKLISMPFGPIITPSIGLSLLKESLLTEHIECEIEYFNIEFAKRIGFKIYSTISNGFPVNKDLLGEWIFSNYLFEKKDNDIESYFENIIKGKNEYHKKDRFDNNFFTDDFKSEIIEIIKIIPDFIDYCTDKIISYNPMIVGFSSVFHQHLASLCLASEIKKRNSNIKIIFGGSNVEGIMGYENIRTFGFIDYIFSGEADKAFPKIAKEILSGKEPNNYKGLIKKEPVNSITKQFKSEVDIEFSQSLIPDYDDYFNAFSEAGGNNYFKPILVIENSRGCWWGEKSQCSFCGINPDTIKFRSKKPEKVFENFKRFIAKYPEYKIIATDNILDMKYFDTVIPQITKDFNDKLQFYEVKANLKKKQLEMLAEANINTLQPGIECLNTKTLKRMNKGVTALQNVRLLKWCRELGITPAWNYLWGFAGETINEHISSAKLMRKIMHLTPPHGWPKMRIDRFSPNFLNYKEMGYKTIFPCPSYRFVYNKLDPQTVNNLAYFFEYIPYSRKNQSNEPGVILKAIEDWKANYMTSDLFYFETSDKFIVCDTRAYKHPVVSIFEIVGAEIIKNCDNIIQKDELYKKIKYKFNSIKINEINEAIGILLDKELIVKEKDTYLSLVIKLNPRFKPSGKSMELFVNWLEEKSF